MELDKTLACITLIRYENYLANFAINNINIWFFAHHILSDIGKLELVVLLIT